MSMYERRRYSYFKGKWPKNYGMPSKREKEQRERFIRCYTALIQKYEAMPECDENKKLIETARQKIAENEAFIENYKKVWREYWAEERKKQNDDGGVCNT